MSTFWEKKIGELDRDDVLNSAADYINTLIINCPESAVDRSEFCNTVGNCLQGKTAQLKTWAHEDNILSAKRLLEHYELLWDQASSWNFVLSIKKNKYDEFMIKVKDGNNGEDVSVILPVVL